MTWTIRRKHHFCVWLLFALSLSGCDWLQRAPQSGSDDSGVDSVFEIRTNLNKGLVENSVGVTSVRQPGIIFGMNDSGHEPLVFAFDSNGTDRGIWRVDRATNRDWESAALGPCARPATDSSCLYIGDTGDNDARRPFVTIYRIREPNLPPTGSSPPNARTWTAERLNVRYPDHPHDVEAMYVTPDGSVMLITKRRLLDVSRRPRPALVFQVPGLWWDSSGIVTARLADSLPIVPGSATGRQVTDAALSPDGKRLAVRTYSEVFVFAVDSTTGLPVQGTPPTSCTILGLEEHQGEGIGWWWDGRRLLLTSEGKNEPLYVVSCTLPAS